MEKLDFSVIVCCYNSNLEKLKKTLISIEKQKDVCFEIILSDDGSLNRDIEQIVPWAEKNGFKNIKYNFLKQNVGTVKNVLSACTLCSAKYVKIISPGDYLFDEFVLKKYLLKFKKTNCALIFSKAVYYTSDGKILKRYNPNATGTKHKMFMKKNLCEFSDCFLGATMAFNIRTADYLKNLDGVVRLMEDYPITYLALQNNEKVCFINDNLVWYECDTGISTTNSGIGIQQEFFNFYNYIEKNYNNKKLKKTLKFLRMYRENKNFATIIKLIFLKPSFFLYLCDFAISSMCRKIYCTFAKPDLELMHKITSL